MRTCAHNPDLIYPTHHSDGRTYRRLSEIGGEVTVIDDFYFFHAEPEGKRL